MIIEKFNVNKFRSLINFKVDKLGPVTTFYGDNNTGKSNILALLYLIFKRKKQYKEDQKILTNNPINFYQGIIENFSYNFFNHEKTNIDFDITINLKFIEIGLDLNFIRKILNISKNVTPTKYFINIKGLFKEHILGNNFGEIIITNLYLNKKEIFNNKNNELHFFPSLDKDKSKQSEYQFIFEKIINPLNDCVSLIGRNRDMQPTKFNQFFEGNLSSKNIKSFLHDLSLSQDKYHIFELIQEIFSKPPYKFGDITFARIGDELEIMIKDGNIRLPIDHVGSGVLQTLYIITHILASESKIVCIEELEQNLSPTRQEYTLGQLKSLFNSTNRTVNQIILSSHSNVFLKHELCDEIYLIDKNNNVTINKSRYKKDDLEIPEDIKKHFITVPGGYSAEEWPAKYAEFVKLNKENLNR
jgi:AAA15 family ATPase/GTPase